MQLRLLAVFLIAGPPACGVQSTVPNGMTGEPPSGRAAPSTSGEVVSDLDKSIFHIFQANDSAYWFGSDSQGAYRYDGTRIIRFTSEHGLPSDKIRSIQEDRWGNIFVSGEGGGVSRFDGSKFIRLTALDTNDSEWKLGPDDLWFPGGQDTGVVYRWDGTSLHRLAFPETSAGRAHLAAFPRSKYPNAKYSPYDVYTTYRDSKGHIWFGTAALGACRYDGTSFDWVGHGENGSFGVRSIIEDHHGQFWLSNTLTRFVEDQSHAIERRAPRYREEPGMATEADPYSVFMSSLRDENGALWIATLSNGVFRHDGSRWNHFPVTHDEKPIWIYSIYRDKENTLWLGTHEHGAFKFNGEAFEKARF